ncbi:MAG TPA: thioredoxin domain-containing protein [Chryseosolibacter sp.]
MSTRAYNSFLFLFAACILFRCAYPSRETRAPAFNRLERADSPYLREHADNPVDWYEWGPEALDKARRENKPLVISIGYASCHWCHVMEEESFMDTAVAALMNRNFVSIKVDREQRPDIDQVYVNTAQLISGNAGWPLNAFALPDGRPFYAATYFPKKEWVALLTKIKNAYKNQHAALVTQAEALTEGVQSYELITSPADSLSRVDQETYRRAFAFWAPYLDFRNGGMVGSPKFPMPVNLEFLLQYHFLTGDVRARRIVTTTLDRMAAGGIYDHLGGGFYRYATDSLWRIPHFEKMLGDNAQLASVYAHAYQLTQVPLYRKILEETLQFVEKEMTGGEGGFYSSINADSEGQEGKYYVWTKKEVDNVVDPEAAEWIAGYYHLTEDGNWAGGKNVLYTLPEPGEGSESSKLPERARMLSRANEQLLAARSKRVRPSTDDKVLTSWNALMLIAYIDGYAATGNRRYLETALKNARFLEAKMLRADGGVWHHYKDGRARIDGFLDDYAFLAQAFIKLYQATFDVHWLTQARIVSKFALLHFADRKSGMFFYTSDTSDRLIARKMEVSDNVLPSSNSAFAWVLAELGEYFQDLQLERHSKVMLNQVMSNIDSGQQVYYGNWYRLAGLTAYRPYEVAVVGDQAPEISLELQRHYHPLALYFGGREENLPLLENKYVEGRTLIYVCRGRVCKRPLENVADAWKQLQ